jgi:UDP-glucose 4-epimerase
VKEVDVTRNPAEHREVAIVGGASLIGSHLVELLQRSRPSWSITILDNFRSANEDKLNQLFRTGQVKLQRLDIRDRDGVAEAVQGVDTVFHMAALLSMSFPDNTREAIEVNVLGAVNVIDACITSRARLVLSSSAGGVYGLAPSGVVNEDAPFWHAALTPGTAMYGSGKILIESLCRDRSDRLGTLDWVGLRYTSVYGLRQHDRGRNTATLRENLVRLHRGMSARFERPSVETHDYVDARDVALANLAAAESHEPANDVFTIGSGHSTSNAELAAILQSVTGSTASTEWLGEDFEVRPEISFDITKASSVLGYVPQIDLKEGIVALYDEIVEDERE